MIKSPYSLDEMQKWVVDIFSDIPSRALEKALDEPDWSLGSAYEDQNVSKLIKYVPVADETILDIIWSMPAQTEFYRIKPLKFYIWLLKHRGEGSILSYMKRNDWANDLREIETEENNYHSKLRIQFRLTESGLANWEQVVKSVFSYLAMIRNLPEGERARIFNEINRIDDIGWTSKEEGESSANCLDIAETMQYIEDSTRWIDGDYLMFDYNSDKLVEVLTYLAPEKCTIILSSKKFDSIAVQEEKWMGGKYVIQDLCETTIESWKQAEVIRKGLSQNGQCYWHCLLFPSKESEFSVPSSNKYLAENLKIKDDEPSTEWDAVRRIEQSEKGELWFKGEGDSNLPRATISLLIRSSLPFENARNMAIHEFFPYILTRTMDNEISDAEIAILHIEIKAETNTINVKLTGINDKLRHVRKPAFL